MRPSVPLLAILIAPVVLATGCTNAKQRQDAAEATAPRQATGPAAVTSTSYGVGGADHPYDLVRNEVIEAPFGPVRISELAVRNPAHADSGMLAVTYLRRDGSGLETAREFPEAVKSGSFGGLGTWMIDNRFSTLPVIVTEGGGTWQGQTCLWTTITELRPSGPVELTTFEQSFSNDGSPDGKPVDIAGKIISIDRDRGFIVRFSGTRNFDAHYVREGNTYTLQGGDDRALHGC